MSEQPASSTVRVAAAQMISAPELAPNLAAAARLIEQAAQAGAVLVALPEYFCIMGHRDTDKLALRERFGDGPIQNFLKDQALRWKITVVGGTVPLDSGEDQRVFNTCLVYGPDGGLLARYDKVHLFRFSDGEQSFDEARTIAPGHVPVTFECAGLTVGMSICYDLRFPELYRALGVCDLMLVPSAFTYTTGKAHWDTLLRARAIENQCYVLAPAQGGTHATGRKTWGHSMLVDPWGSVQAVLPKDEGVVIGDIDPKFLKSVRKNLPALNDRTALNSRNYESD